MFRVIIPSRTLSNLEACVRAIRTNEPHLYADQIIVVDDDETGGIKSYCTEQGLTRVAGQKPFVFARNANLGLTVAFTHVDTAILLNDDALLTSRRGFSNLVQESIRHPQYGLLSSATNVVGNENQRSQGAENIRRELRTLCFICVLITRQCWQKVGLLDEDFHDCYGWEDTAYCESVKAAGLRMGIVDKCFVDHSSLKSTFRSGEYPVDGFQKGRDIYERKWGVQK